MNHLLKYFKEKTKNYAIWDKTKIVSYEWNGKKLKGLKQKPILSDDVASQIVLKDRR